MNQLISHAKPLLGILVFILSTVLPVQAQEKVEPLSFIWEGKGDKSTFYASVTPLDEELFLGQHTAWQLSLRRKDGKPLERASIAISAGMFGEGHGHGMPASPKVTEYLGDGQYRIEGVLFNMMGEWTFFFDVEEGGAKDRVRIDINFDHRYL